MQRESVMYLADDMNDQDLKNFNSAKADVTAEMDRNLRNLMRGKKLSDIANTKTKAFNDGIQSIGEQMIHQSDKIQLETARNLEQVFGGKFIGIFNDLKIFAFLEKQDVCRLTPGV